MMKSLWNHYFKETIWPGVIISLALVPVIFTADLYREALSPSQYITPAVGPALMFAAGPYLLYALAGFGFFHTKHGSKIVIPYNFTALALIPMWIVSAFYYWPENAWTSHSLDNLLSTIISINWAIVFVPFIIFYATTPSKDRFGKHLIEVKVQEKH